jgi:hypothetical protein
MVTFGSPTMLASGSDGHDLPWERHISSPTQSLINQVSFRNYQCSSVDVSICTHLMDQYVVHLSEAGCLCPRRGHRVVHCVLCWWRL